MPEEKTLSHKRFIMYIVGFIASLSYALPTYINSTYLSTFISPALVGILYTASSILAIAAFVEMPYMLKRFGNFQMTIAILLLELLSLAGLAVGHGTLAVISAFILNFVSIALINLCFDVFLEEFSTNSKTGKIRGIFLTISNTAWLISPILSAKILGENNYSNMFMVSGLLLIPVIALVFTSLRGTREPEFNKLPFWKSFGEVWADRNIKGILFLQLLLQIFYAWMIIYMPMYLHNTIGFDWTTIGVIFTIMLLPFVLLDAPLGYLADKNGEKKMLSIGFFIIGAATFCVALVTDHNPVIWAIVLFMTRVGAAIIEIMTETYFFKKVDATKTHFITFSRMIRPFAYILSPVLATILFTVFDMKGLFVFLGFLLFYGLRYSFAIDDVK
jgi:MFS family permease